MGARLRHGPVPAGVDRRPWPLRSTDLDGMGHVNNAATWEPVEDELARRGLRPRWAELEYGDGLDPADEVELASLVAADGSLRVWLTVGGAVRATAVVHPSSDHPAPPPRGGGTVLTPPGRDPATRRCQNRWTAATRLTPQVATGTRRAGGVAGTMPAAMGQGPKAPATTRRRPARSSSMPWLSRAAAWTASHRSSRSPSTGRTFRYAAR